MTEVLAVPTLLPTSGAPGVGLVTDTEETEAAGVVTEGAVLTKVGSVVAGGVGCVGTDGMTAGVELLAAVVPVEDVPGGVSGGVSGGVPGGVLGGVATDGAVLTTVGSVTAGGVGWVGATGKIGAEELPGTSGGVVGGNKGD
jgi:hypothetical protein